MRQNAWKHWYPTKRGVFDEDMPLLEQELRADDISRILDLGCGTGRHTIYFAERGFEVYGFDFASDAIEEAKRRLKEGGLQAELRVWDARRKFPYKDGFFGAVLVVRVFHHYPTKTIKKIAEETSRVTRREGYLYIQVPTLRRVLKYARTAKEEGKPQIKVEKGTYVPIDGPEKGVPHHGFTRQELRELFSDYRIKSISLRDEHYNLLGVKK